MRYKARSRVWRTGLAPPRPRMPASRAGDKVRTTRHEAAGRPNLPRTDLRSALIPGGRCGPFTQRPFHFVPIRPGRISRLPFWRVNGRQWKCRFSDRPFTGSSGFLWINPHCSPPRTFFVHSLVSEREYRNRHSKNYGQIYVGTSVAFEKRENDIYLNF